MGKVIWINGGDFMTRRNITSIDIVSNYFLSKESMSQKKLQKICYYAYSWYLTLYDELLFDNGKFEAWVHGPVNPGLYSKYKTYGWRDIPSRREPQLDMGIKEFLDIIYNTFGDYTGDELESMTHSESPWIKARQGLEPEVPSNNIIDDVTIKSFYSSLMENGQVE